MTMYCPLIYYNFVSEPQTMHDLGSPEKWNNILPQALIAIQYSYETDNG